MQIQWLIAGLRRLLHIAEPIILLVMVIAFWHHSPPIRDDWVWLLWLALPIFALRLVIYRRLFTVTPLLPLLLIFILLTLFNFENAPFHRENYEVLVCRPLLGIWLYLYCVEHVRMFRRMDGLLIATLGMAFITGFLALTASQWNSKIAALQFLVDALPHIVYKTWLPDMLLSFNPNEIAGALAWFCPLLAGLMLYQNPNPVSKTSPSNPLANMTSPPSPITIHDLTPQPPLHTWRGGVGVGSFFAAIAFAIGFSALFFGQSRFALAGVLLALTGIVFLGMRGRGRLIALIGIGGVLLLQGALMANILRAPENTTATLSLSGRDQESLSVRFEMWASGIRMMTDYPLTGVGMSMFRGAVQQPQYAIPFYVEQNSYPPHVHNEWLQMGVDLGIPGFLLFISWHLVIVGMLWRAWRNSDAASRIVVISIGGGLLAHAFYGMGDAITLWDRYSFVFWWMLGLAGAVYRQFGAWSAPVETR